MIKKWQDENKEIAFSLILWLHNGSSRALPSKKSITMSVRNEMQRGDQEEVKKKKKVESERFYFICSYRDCMVAHLWP